MNYIKTLLLAGLLISPTLGAAAPADGSAIVVGTSPCDVQSCETDAELQQARAYLLQTARPGGTMARQGPELAIERLHPEFAKRLADAIRAARDNGLADAGVFSAYRPPAFGVGGFSDKYYSLHAYGLAVDMSGIGRPGSPEAQQWHEIAAENGIVCPYGYRDRAEWNHCQPTHLVSVKVENPLRETISGTGPIDLQRMFEAGNHFIADAASTLTSVIADRPVRAIMRAAARPVRALISAATPARAHASGDARVSLASRQQSRKARRTELAGRFPSASRRARAPAKVTAKSPAKSAAKSTTAKSPAAARAHVAMLVRRPK